MRIPAKHLARILLELDEHRADLAQADQEHEHALTVWAVTNEERNKKLSEAIGRAHTAEAMAEGWKKEHDRVKAELDETRDALATARQAAGIRATERLDHATETRDRVREEADKVREAAARHPSGPIILPSEPF